MSACNLWNYIANFQVKVKVSCNLRWRHRGGVVVKFYSFLTSAPKEVDVQCQFLVALPGTQYIGSWIGTRAGVDVCRTVRFAGHVQSTGGCERTGHRLRLTFDCTIFLKRFCRECELSDTKIIWSRRDGKAAWLWNTNGIVLRVGTEILGEKSIAMPVFLPQISRALTCYRNWHFSVQGLQLIAWDMTRPGIEEKSVTTLDLRQ